MIIPASRPDITETERQAVLEVLRGPILSIGPKLEAFEHALAKYVSVAHAIGVNSATSGLHLIVRALGLGPGDEVITTPFSFVASANCLLFEGARPVFVDIDPETLNLDVRLIEASLSERTRAILAVDVFGHPADWNELEHLANLHDLKLIDDSAEALGAVYRGRKAGSFGEAGVFGFYPNKQITTGEGGVVLTNNSKLASLCRSMRNQGRADNDAWLAHPRLGYNYRLDELSAALGLAQLSRLEEILQCRDHVAQLYGEKLADIEEISLLTTKSEIRRSWFVYVVKLASGIDRQQLMAYLAERGIQTRPYFSPIHLQPFYRERFGYREGRYPITESVSRCTLALPFYNRLGVPEVDYVVRCLKEGIRRS
jgi:perosamine synthetase